MKLIDINDVETGKYYIIYDYSIWSRGGSSYRGIIVWKYTHKVPADLCDYPNKGGKLPIKYVYGKSPLGFHVARSELSFNWNCWEVSSDSNVSFNSTRFNTLTIFQLTEQELIDHVVLAVI